MVRRLTQISFLGAAFLVLTACPGLAANYDWGTTGVSDTTVVNNIEQLTDNPYNDGVVSGDYPTSSGFAPHPWNSTGDWIVYTANTTDINSSGNKEIFVSRPDGTGKTRLTDNLLEDSNASFGTDGRIYFERFNGSSHYEIWRMDSDGTNPANLTAAHSGMQYERKVAPSPDSSKISYWSNNALWVANADGTGPVQVSKTGFELADYNGNYGWSPDSSRLAYNCYVTTDTTGYQWTYQICVVNADGTGHDQLTDTLPGSGQNSWPVWSPDGSKIAFLQESSPEYMVRTINPDGSGLVSVDAFSYSAPGWTNHNGPLSWSPDSNWLAYTKRWYNGPPDYTDYYTIHMANVNTLVKHQLTQDYSDYAPFWSPTGGQILFADSSNYSSRDANDAFGTGTGNNGGDLLLINLIGEYAPPTVTRFPWPMFLPAIEKAGKK
ncbi:MAG TPA: hypothetical protein DDY20_07930 [Desulfobulbaceae bacterium]|nr:hypothetical protein [Desulfobulbaceae bacterium]